jgi:hypothetical protein
MKRVARIGILIVACATIGVSGCGHGEVSNPGSVAAANGHEIGGRTQVVGVRPTNERGMLKHGYIITAHESVEEDPWTCQGSSVVAGAYRCPAEHGIFDPCWPLGGITSAHDVFCLRAPWQHTVTEVSFRGHLELPTPYPCEPLFIWGVRLSNGGRCVALQGAVGMFHGTPIGFGCGGSELELLGVPNMAHALWTIREVYLHQTTQAPYYYHTYGPIGRIAVAWYGLSATG